MFGSRVMRVIVLILFVCASVGCDSASGDKITKGESLKESQAVSQVVTQKEPDLQLLKSRSKERWSMMIKRDFDAVYAYLSPERRKFLSVAGFKQTIGNSIEWQSVEIKSASVDGKKGEVEVLINYRPLIPGMPMDEGFSIPETLTEKWYWDGSNWWYAEEAGKGLKS